MELVGEDEARDQERKKKLHRGESSGKAHRT